MPTAVRREVKAIFCERKGCPPLKFAIRALPASGCAGVFGGTPRLGRNIPAMELPPIAPQSRVLSPFSTGNLIAASRVYNPVLRLGSVIVVIGLKRRESRHRK